VVDLGLFRQVRDFALRDRAKNAAGLEDFHPLHAAYTYVMNTVTSSAELLCELPELVRLGRQIAEIEEDYMPSGPPMSPITGSYFTNWAVLDLGVGLHKESLGSLITLVEMAWNFPILTQNSPDSAALGKDLDDRLALLPAEVRSVIEGMFRARATTYAHDPRTARVIVEDDGRGGITVKAEARLVPGVIPE
jgi:hypothetical protein